MATMQIVYWRDIPAQIKGREGRKRSSLPLEERFEKAIDAAAMRGGADSTDDYLADFYTTDPIEVEGDLAQAMADKVAELQADFDTEKLRAYIANEGRSPA